MDESSIISKFDKLVNSGTVMYNDQQEIIEHIDGELKVSAMPSRHFSVLTAISVPIRTHISVGEEASSWRLSRTARAN